MNVYPPDNVDRSRASANCVGSFLHSTWWAQQALNAYRAMTTSFPIQQGLGGYSGVFGGLGQAIGGLGQSLSNLFGKP